MSYNTLIPIIIGRTSPKCPNCKQDEDIKQVCNHCGYVYPKNNKTPFWLKVFLGFVWLFMLIVVCFMVDKELLDSRYYNKIIIGSNCNYDVPKDYKIVYNLDTKKYAIRVLEFGDYYLYERGRQEIEPMFSNISEPTLFDDSCSAKGVLKRYIESIQPKVSGYK